MFLGGSYHDRDNPSTSKPHDGKALVWMTLVCNQMDGRDSSAAAGGLQITGDDLMMMMMRMIFYGGTGTKCTENKIVTRNSDDDDDDDGNKSNKTNGEGSNNRKQEQMKTRPMDYGHDQDKRRCHDEDDAIDGRMRMTTRTKTPRTTWKMTTTRLYRMDEDHTVALFEFVGWELCPSAHEHASNLSIQRHDDGRRRRELTYKTDLM
jgi:hypothetical protein